MLLMDLDNDIIEHKFDLQNKYSTVQSGGEVKGTISLETMTSSFKDLETCEDFEEKVPVVSKIHDIILIPICFIGHACLEHQFLYLIFFWIKV